MDETILYCCRRISFFFIRFTLYIHEFGHAFFPDKIEMEKDYTETLQTRPDEN